MKATIDREKKEIVLKTKEVERLSFSEWERLRNEIDQKIAKSHRY